MKKNIALLLFISVAMELPAQQNRYRINIEAGAATHKVIIRVNDQPFTEWIYPDSLEKPVLFPIYAPDGQIITRGYPVNPRKGEPEDHPHHVGLWLNYENVNGLDFWNNSFAIPPDKKKNYGWIKTGGPVKTVSGESGILEYNADWVDQQHAVLLKEVTRFIFSANDSERTIDRITTLTAVQDVHFPDTKDGLLGLRVAHELQIPATQSQKFADNKGNVTTVSPGTTASGNYLTSEGKQGDSAWGTRGQWCLLYGKMNKDTMSIVIIDHPGNPGYPTYWHARGYGLFSANPLGQKIFSNGKQVLNLSLKKGESISFRYRIVIASGQKRMGATEIQRRADEFAEKPESRKSPEVRK